MVSRAHELKIVNTVCPVTIRRQEDTLETARGVELMVVVGGRHSANTKELTRLCAIAGTPAVQIENARDLVDPVPFERVRVVGPQLVAEVGRERGSRVLADERPICQGMALDAITDEDLLAAILDAMAELIER